VLLKWRLATTHLEFNRCSMFCLGILHLHSHRYLDDVYKYLSYAAMLAIIF